jgi:very-short-patch-repair endonuclease
MSRSSNNDQTRIWAVRDRTRAAPQSLLARGMRRMPTNAEQKLWWHLHRLSMKGSHFRRQVRIGRYIADFASHKQRIVIEVDGGQHAGNAADAARSRFIEERGYRVLRFWNNDVLGNIDGVLEVITNAIAAANGFEERNPTTDSASSPSPLAGEGRGGGSCDRGTAMPYLTTPTPNPSPQGGGEQKAAHRPQSPVSRARE